MSTILDSDATLESIDRYSINLVGNSLKITIPNEMVARWGLPSASDLIQARRNTSDTDDEDDKKDYELPRVFVYRQKRGGHWRMVVSTEPLTQGDKDIVERELMENSSNQIIPEQALAFIRGMLLNNNTIDLDLLTSLTSEDTKFWTIKFYELIGTGKLRGKVEGKFFVSDEPDVDKVIEAVKSINGNGAE